MAGKRDYYDILGISRNASAAEIKNAFRKLVLKYHPDLNKDKQTEEKMKELNEAYAVLSDPEKRRQYDTFGPEGFSQRFTQEDIFRNFNIDEIFRQMGIQFGFGDSDLFSMFNFGGGASRGMDIGSDILASVDVTLREAATGTNKKVFVSHVKQCETCGGAGGTGVQKCSRCNGTGQASTTRRTPFGVMKTITPCPDCGGSGKTVEKACRRCNGKGRVRAEDKIDFKVPPGVDTGTRLRVRGMGDYGKDRQGDLYVDINVLKDKTFTRRGNDLLIDLHVPFYVAALGGTAQVETLDGQEKVKIEPGTQTDAKLYLEDMGIPKFNGGGRGDEVIRVIVDTPKWMSAEQRSLIERFAELDSGKRPDGKKKFGIF
ncbi:MAG: DnaJ domain-containing protein [Candidatus Marsarchaeota archaeon]|nr:DnaJ domain-containing protein [Candidatus Marsarchaeota archaeon]MCL5111851.1 DnaJ domain-containing protein [Candidatus Marsarchaeota archaeon]